MSRKRYVKVDLSKDEGSSKDKAAPDVEAKTKALDIIIYAHLTIEKKAELPLDNDIDEWSKVTSLVSSVITRIRQKINKAQKWEKKKDADIVWPKVEMLEPSLKKQKKDDGTDMEVPISIGSDDYTWADFHKDVLARIIHVSGYPEDQLKGKPIMGTLVSVLALFVGFNRRLGEITHPNLSIIIEKGAEDVELQLKTLGFSDSHQHLLSGSRFSPVLQSSMTQCLGPFTILANLIICNNSSYTTKWKSAFIHAFGLIDGAAEMANELYASKQIPNKIVLHYLALAAGLGLVRTSHKAFIPFAFIRELITADYLNFTVDPKFKSTRTSIVWKMDFSGQGMWKLLNAVSTKEFKMRGDKEIMQQVLVHAVLGTHSESLNVLEWASGIPFKSRNEMAKEIFKERSKQKQSIVKFPLFKRISKLLSSSSGNQGSGNKGQEFRLPVFAGKVSQKVDKESFLVKLMSETTPNMQASVRVSACERMMNHIKLVQAKVIKDEILTLGTTAFFKNNATGESVYGAEEEYPFGNDHRYFFGRAE